MAAGRISVNANTKNVFSKRPTPPVSTRLHSNLPFSRDFLPQSKFWEYINWSSSWACKVEEQGHFSSYTYIQNQTHPSSSSKYASSIRSPIQIFRHNVRCIYSHLRKPPMQQPRRPPAHPSFCLSRRPLLHKERASLEIRGTMFPMRGDRQLRREGGRRVLWQPQRLWGAEVACVKDRSISEDSDKLLAVEV